MPKRKRASTGKGLSGKKRKYSAKKVSAMRKAFDKTVVARGKASRKKGTRRRASSVKSTPRRRRTGLYGPGPMGVPSFGNVKASASGGVIVSHREYVADVYSQAGTSGGPTAFNCAEYILNPGNSITFPWLAPIARSFEEYRIRKMIWQFRSTSGNSVASGNTALGAVMLATQYNVTNGIFSSKIEMENYAQGQSGVPSEDILHVVDVKKSVSPLKTLYVREDNQPVPTGQDPRLYDFGKFSIATQGMQTNAIDLGELWCSYVIELIKPKVPDFTTSPLLSPLADHFALTADNMSVTGKRYFGVTGGGEQGPTAGSTLQGMISDIAGFGNYYLFPGYNMDKGFRLPIGTVALLHFDTTGPATTLTTSQIGWIQGANWSGYTIFRGDGASAPDYNNIDGALVITVTGGLLCIQKTSDDNATGDNVQIATGTLCGTTGNVGTGDLLVTLLPFNLQ